MSIKLQQRLIAWSLGLVYLWFGVLKFFPHTSSVEGLVNETLSALFLGHIPEAASIYIIGIWEVAAAILLILGWKVRWAAISIIIHLLFTFTPYVLFPEVCFSGPLVFTMTGQYIFKNVVFLVAALILTVSAEK